MKNWSMILVIAMLVVTGCSQVKALAVPSVKEVQSVELNLGVPDLQGSLLPQPLNVQNPKDREIVVKLLGWLKAAPKVGEGTTPLPQIGVHTLVFHYKNGKMCSVYPKGGRDGSIMLWDCGNGKPVQLETPKFGHWLEVGWKNDIHTK